MGSYSLIGLAYTAAFLLLTKISAMFAVASGVMVWYAPAGLNIALLMIFGLRHAPAIFVAGLLGGLFILAPEAPLMPLIIVALTTPAVEALAVFLLGRSVGGDWRRWRFREFGRFILFILATPVPAALAGIANYCLFGMIPWAAFSDVMLGWWIGDVIGIATVTPFFLFAVHPWVRLWKQNRRPFSFFSARDGRNWDADGPGLFTLIGQLVSIPLALWVCFRSPYSEVYDLDYLCFLPMIWVVFQHGLPGAAVAVAALNTGATLFSVPSTTLSEVTNLQFFLMMLSLTGLILGKALSEGKRTETALRDSEEELKEVTDNLPGMVYRFVRHADGSYSVPYVSRQSHAYAGKTPDEIISDVSQLFRSVPPGDLERVQRAIERSAEQKEDYRVEHRMIGADGKARWFDVRSSPKQREHGEIVWCGVAIDVTEKVDAERKLRTERAQLLSIFDAIPAIVDVVDPRTYDLLFLNQYAWQLLGEDAMEKKCFQAFHDFDAPCDFCTNQRLLNRPDQDLHWEYYSRKLGRHFMTTNKIIQWPDGRDVKFELSFDITERKRTEQQLILADKMASLGLLSAGLAHEINNPVNLISLNTSLLKEIWEDFLPVLEGHSAHAPQKRYGGLKVEYLRSKLPGLIDDVHLAAHRIESTVANLKHFSRMSDSRHREPVHVNTAIRNAVRLAQSTLKKSNIQLELDLQDPLPEIDANLQNVEQILLNLMINAIEAHEGNRGKITIQTAFDKDRKTVTVLVADTGKGVDPEIADNIFDPFVTTRLAEGGTGLGLAIVYNLVQSFGGDIDVQSERGKGAAFTVSFPMSGGESAKT